MVDDVWVPGVLAKARDAAGLTSGELADKVGISRPHLSMIESKRRQPSLPVAIRISKALGKSIEELFPDVV